MPVRLARNNRILKVMVDTRLLLNIFGMRRGGHSTAELEAIHRYHRDALDAVVGRGGLDGRPHFSGNTFARARKNRLKSTRNGSARSRFNRAMNLNVESGLPDLT
jgi:hypothetical protein